MEVSATESQPPDVEIDNSELNDSDSDAHVPAEFPGQHEQDYVDQNERCDACYVPRTVIIEAEENARRRRENLPDYRSLDETQQ